MFRGNVEIFDIRRNIERFKFLLNFIYWNQEGWKIGLCFVFFVGYLYLLLVLFNNICIRYIFQDFKDRFMKFYKRKVYVYYYIYVDGMEVL